VLTSRNEGGDLPAISIANRRAGPAGADQHGVPPSEQRPDFRIRADPAGSEARLLENVMPERNLRPVVVDRDRLAAIGQLVELASRQRVPDLALDQALPAVGELWLALPVATNRANRAGLTGRDRG
jgi:hypothetical protein